MEAAMRTETVEKIARKSELLSAEQQAKVLEFVEGFDAAPRSLYDIVRNLVEEIPEDVLNRLPTDGSINHDHYLYGAPKKQ
jgi:hypothetical protein